MARSLILFFIFLVGCSMHSTRNVLEKRPIFDDLYQKDQKRDEMQSKNQVFPRVNIVADSMRLQDFARQIADMTGVSVVTAKDLDDEKVTIQVTDQPVNVVLSSVARRLGAQIVANDNLYYIGTLRPEDRGNLVRKVSRMNAEQVHSICALAISEVGRVWTGEDGLVVVSDRVEVLSRINDIFDKVELAEPGIWVAQYYIISVTEDMSRELGLDLTQVGSISARYALGSLAAAPLDDKQVGLTASFSALLIAAKTSANGRIIASPMLLTEDGVSGHITSGLVIPVPRKVTSDQGTVSVVGFDQVRTGFSIDSKVRTVGRDSALLTVDLSMSTQQGFVLEAPILQQSTFSTVAKVSSGGVYLLGQLNSQNQIDSGSGLFFETRIKKTKGQSQMQIWCRVYQVSGSVTP